MGEGEHTHEQVPVIAPVVSTGDALVAPVVDHAAKIAEIEQKQAQHEEKLFRELGELESRLRNASGDELRMLAERIAGVESKLEAAAMETVETVPDAVELAAPEVENSPAPPEKERRGLRHRRRARRKGGNKE